MRMNANMEAYKDFTLDDRRYSKGDYDLTYTGTEKNIVIPEDLVAETKDLNSLYLHTKRKGCTSITIPKNVPNLWLHFSFDSENCTAFDVDPESPYLKDIDGVLFTKNGKILLKVPCKMDKEYTVPEGVEELSSFCFKNANFQRVTLPAGLLKIGQYAFEFSKNLEEVSLPDSLIELENHAFQLCKKLRSVVLPEGVKRLDFDAFHGCESLEHFVFQGNTEIDFRYSCKKEVLKGLWKPQLTAKDSWSCSEAYLLACLKRYNDLEQYLPQLMTSAKVGGRTQILDYLNEMYLKTPIVEQMGTYSVAPLNETEAIITRYEGNEAHVTIPDFIHGKKTTAIGTGAFRSNYTIKHVTLPTTITEIRTGAFEDCIMLEQVDIPQSVTSIGRKTFKGCTLLHSIILPEGLTELANKVFYDCSLLENLHIPASVKGIGLQAFHGCSKLNAPVLPDGLLEIGKQAFYGCSLFDHGPKTDESWGYTKVAFTIPASVTKIGGSLFGRYPTEDFGVFEYKVVIRGVKDTMAHQFALDHGMEFVEQ